MDCGKKILFLKFSDVYHAMVKHWKQGRVENTVKD